MIGTCENKFHKNMKKLYVIVEYDIRNGEYLEYSVDGLVFKDKKTAEKYLSTKPFPYNMDIEELTLYEVD